MRTTCDPFGLNSTQYDASKCNPLGSLVETDLRLFNPSNFTMTPVGHLCFTLNICPAHLQNNTPAPAVIPRMTPAQIEECAKHARFVSYVRTQDPLTVLEGLNPRIVAKGPYNPPPGESREYAAELTQRWLNGWSTRIWSAPCQGSNENATYTRASDVPLYNPFMRKNGGFVLTMPGFNKTSSGASVDGLVAGTVMAEPNLKAMLDLKNPKLDLVSLLSCVLRVPLAHRTSDAPNWCDVLDYGLLTNIKLGAVNTLSNSMVIAGMTLKGTCTQQACRHTCHPVCSLLLRSITDDRFLLLL